MSLGRGAKSPSFDQPELEAPDILVVHPTFRTGFTKTERKGGEEFEWFGDGMSEVPSAVPSPAVAPPTRESAAGFAIPRLLNPGCVAGIVRIKEGYGGASSCVERAKVSHRLSLISEESHEFVALESAASDDLPP